MINDEDTHYRLNAYLLSIIGHSSHQNRILKYFIRFLFYLTVLSFLIPQYLGYQKAWGDVDAIIECIPPTIFVLASLFFAINMAYNGKKMQLILTKIKYDWKIATVREVEILNAYVKTGRTISNIYASFIFGVLFVYLSMPMVPLLLDMILPLNETRPRKGIYYLDYKVDEEEYFYLIMIHNCWLSFFTACVVVCSDTVFMEIIQHACGIFAIIGNRLNNLVNISFANKYEGQNLIREEIVSCAKKHKRIMIFVSDIENFLSTIHFLVLGMNMILMSITGVQVVIKIHEPKEACRFAVYTFGQILHLFFLTVPCEQLINHSVNISSCIYNGGWYRLSLKMQKMLLIIMRKSSEPCSFVSGKLYTYSMQSFAAVLHSSMSYFTLLMSVR